jgi:hypothetical protein
MKSLELDFPFVDAFDEGDGEGSHASLEKMIVVGLNDEMNVIGLHRIVNNT